MFLLLIKVNKIFWSFPHENERELLHIHQIGPCLFCRVHFLPFCNNLQRKMLILGETSATTLYLLPLLRPIAYVNISSRTSRLLNLMITRLLFLTTPGNLWHAWRRTEFTSSDDILSTLWKKPLIKFVFSNFHTAPFSWSPPQITRFDFHPRNYSFILSLASSDILSSKSGMILLWMFCKSSLANKALEWSTSMSS